MANIKGDFNTRTDFVLDSRPFTCWLIITCSNDVFDWAGIAGHSLAGHSLAGHSLALAGNSLALAGHSLALAGHSLALAGHSLAGLSIGWAFIGWTEHWLGIHWLD